MELTVRPGFDAHGEVDVETTRRVAAAWLAGGVVGLPTETVYGLAADAQDAEAVARVYRAKGRPADHPLIVHVAGPEALAGWSARPNRAAVRLAEVFWPGPLTVVVARSPRAGDFLTGGQDTVALRCPAHAVARACIRALAVASGDAARGVAAPSANRFGRVSPTRAADVVAEVGDRLDPRRDLVVDGGPSAVGVESTIVDCTADPPRVLRLGAISQAQVDAALATGGQPARGHHPVPVGAAPTPAASAPARPPAAHAATAVRAAGRDSGPGDGPADEVRAPGTLQSHYAPHARVILVAHAPTGDGGPGGAGSHARPSDSWSWPVGLAAVGMEAGDVTGGDGRPLYPGLIAEHEVPTPEGWVRLLAADDAEAYARDLYAALRRADALGLAAVVAVLPDPAEGPLANAVRDRLTRAAHRDEPQARKTSS